MTADDVATPPVGALREPMQARARATFDRILQAAIEILSTEGLGALNTNRVADRAGVNIATLYSYFANKEGILAHLAHRFEDARAASVEVHARELGADSDWARWFDDSIDAMVRFRLDEPGCVVVRQALLALPDLAEFDRESTRRATEAKVPGLRRLNPDLSEEQARAISHVYTLSVTTVLDEAFHSSPHDWSMIAELKRMMHSYFATYLP